MKNMNLRYKKTWLLLGFVMIAFVVYETLTSSPIGSGMKISDKFLHVAGYFGMMGWFVQIIHNSKHRLLLAAGFVCMGITLEFLQGWGGIRQYEVADMLANATGVMSAWLLALTRFSNILLLVESGLGKQDAT
jgi:VanZ family protein